MLCCCHNFIQLREIGFGPTCPADQLTPVSPRCVGLESSQCSIIWSKALISNVNKINKLQKKACKLILSNDYTCLNESLEQVNILSFD